MCVSGPVDHTAATRYKPNEAVPARELDSGLQTQLPGPPPTDPVPHLWARRCEAEPLVNERLWAAEV